jgi:hypothetical protein
MYKSRIWKWGLDKKLKRDEVLAILILKQERDAQQKLSQFTIRGQPVDMDNINRYVKRNAGLLSRVRAGERPSVQSSHEVACYTPPPSPTSGVATTIGAPASTPPSYPNTAVAPYTIQQGNLMTPYHDQVLVSRSGQTDNWWCYGGTLGAAYLPDTSWTLWRSDYYPVDSPDPGAADRAAYPCDESENRCCATEAHTLHQNRSSRYYPFPPTAKAVTSSQTLSLQS